MKNAALSLVFGAALALQGQLGPAWAGSSISATNLTGGQLPANSVSANLNFSLVVPKFLSLQVGSTGATINSISFSPTAAQVGTGAAIAGVGGDLGGGAVTVIAQGNSGGGQGTLSYRTTTSAGAALAALTNGTQTIAWSTIKVASAGSATLAHPAALANASAAAVTISSTLGLMFNLSATWTYTWNDGGTVNPASTYTGRVAYSLTQP